MSASCKMILSSRKRKLLAPIEDAPTKTCVYNGCGNYDHEVRQFVQFAKPCLSVREKEVRWNTDHIYSCMICTKCERWLLNCAWLYRSRYATYEDINDDTYVCLTHFVDVNGPTEAFPDPLPLLSVFKIRKLLKGAESLDGNNSVNAISVGLEEPTNALVASS